MTEAEDRNIAVRDDHPERESEQTKARDEQSMRELISQVESDINDIAATRSEWGNRLEHWYKNIYGIRPQKTFPWKGCSNLAIPLIDSSIKKLLPNYMNLIWSPESIYEFRVPPNASQRADLDRFAEYNTHVLDHVIKDRMDDSFLKSYTLINTMLRYGFALMKVTYNYKTEPRQYEIDLFKDLNEEQQLMLAQYPDLFSPEAERALFEMLGIIFEVKGIPFDPEDDEDVREVQRVIQQIREGKKVVNVRINQIINNAPSWQVVHPSDIIVAGHFNDVQEATIVCHRMYWTPNNLRIAARSGLFGRAGARVVKEIISKKGTSRKYKNTNNTQIFTGDGDLDQAISTMSGSYHFGTDTDDLIEIREVCFYAMADSSGILRRCVLTYSPDYTEEALKFVVLPYDDNQWPYVRFVLEPSLDGWLTPRGIPAMLDHLATALNVRHNQLVDNLTLSNAPMIMYVPGKVTLSNVRYIPGQGVPVADTGAIAPIQVPPGNPKGIQEEMMYLERWAEGYIANPDFGMMDKGQSGLQARTATEIASISAQREQMFSLDAQVFLDALTKLGEMTWSRWMQYGDDNYELMIKGEKNPVTWQKGYGTTQMQIKPRGTLQGTNPAIRVRKAELLMQVAAHPIFGPMLKTYEVLGDYVGAVAIHDKNKYMYDHEEWAKQMTQMQEQQAQAAQQQAEAAFQGQVQMEQMKVQGDIAKIAAESKARTAEAVIQGSIDAQKDKNAEKSE